MSQTRTQLPNFLYIGPDKAGSSWLHEVLIRHPEIFLTPAKDLYFFDRYFDRGASWYQQQFRDSRPHHDVVGEVCQDYLFHPEAAERINEVLGPVKLMVTLREPAQRAFSSYLYMLKQGQQPGTFREALAARPELIEHGRYGSGLRRFLRYNDPQAVHVALFDDLVEEPQVFVDGVLAFLGVSAFTLDESLLAARLPASQARSVVLARLARRAADWVREHDGARAVGAVKRSSVTQKLLYRPLSRPPQLSADDAAYVRSVLEAEIAEVEETFGVQLRRRWGWAGAP